MRFGIVILPDQPWSQGGDRWRRAESYGFDHAWTYDHLAWRSLADGPWFDAVTTLTAAALSTSRIRLGTLVANPSIRHPVSFARQLMALDDLSGGRFTLGVGAGAAVLDQEILGDTPLTPRALVDRFGEFVELVDALLTTDHVDFSGEYFTAVDARTLPGCVQRPRLPFLVAANGPRSMRIAARFGQGWVTTGPKVDDLDAWWKGVAELADRHRELTNESEVDRCLSLDAGPVFSLSSVDYFAEATGRAAELGFTDVITHWPRESEWYAGDVDVLEDVVTSVIPRYR
ncbi:LLM class flavin-dependent oxidoreductase [Allokutzneria sp. A3M-2-11 16]|uniref:LLM class flavin-dependent oxidoreductase n=1 Tax=Allokutzneria sp. A3M-2-11 16 TaxID=2962043 RepID=UPI0020B85E71|nr:LLM class flavin-dependent oxidoreductase [Allokutzneria sp. A3M-2-11 16]MCP3799650.1 LLM class flavin-dependent oxidoreductase [Allokutzneria sp. A3M-2-11 16]